MKQLKLIIQFCCIVLLIEISEWVLSILNITRVPVAIFALIILFSLLYTKVLKTEYVEGVSQILIKNMGLFFVPLGVKIVAHMEALDGILISVIAIVIIATVVTQISIALVAKLIFSAIYKNQKREVTT